MGIEDPLDYELMHRTILLQAVDDFIKLMHPKRRRKKHLAHAWVTAVACLFDNDYILQLRNESHQAMVLEDLLKAASDRENVDITRFRKHVVKEAIRYWKERPVKTVKIPKNVTVEGHVYYIKIDRLAPGNYYIVDYDAAIITLYGDSDSTEQLFCAAVTEIMAFHHDLKVSKAARDTLAEAWFNTLRMNNCFIGD